MSNAKVSSSRGNGVGSMVVAVDSEHMGSQHALKWAIDRLLYRDTSPARSIVLLNVRRSSPIVSFNHPPPPYDLSNTTMIRNFTERQPDDHEMESLRPFQGFCARRQIGYEVVVVEDEDVGLALVDYATRHRTENMLLGSPSRNGISRLFKHGSSGITSTVMKWIPNFCNLYIISKLGKLNHVRNAYNQVPPLHPHTTNISGQSFEFSPQTSPSIFLSFYNANQRGKRSSFDDFHFLLNQRTPTSLFLTHKLESMEEDIKRLKLLKNHDAAKSFQRQRSKS